MENILEKQEKFLIYIHSPICPVSRGALQIIEKYKALPESLEVITIDVFKEKEIREKIVQKYKILKKSPMVLLIENQECKKILPPSRIFLKAIKELSL